LDLRSLALFRIALSACLIVSHLLRLPGLGAFYTDQGVLPRAALIEARDPLLSLHLISGAWAIQFGLFALALVAAVGLMLGYRTRLAAVVSWVLITSLLIRNPLASHAGDHELRLLLFWCMFLPLNGRWSLDRPPAGTPTYLSPAGVALILQVGAVYWFAFAEKMNPVWLTERSAVYYALNLDMIARPLGILLRDHHELTRFLTAGTMALELLGPFLLISPIFTGPLRLLAVASFIAFHAGLGLTMRLGTFPWICAAAWLAFLPSFIWGAKSPVGPARKPGALETLLVVASILLITSGLLAPTLRPQDPAEAGFFRRLSILMGWEQRWPMFSPRPTTEDGWYVMEGVTSAGRRVDVWTEAEPTYDRPADFAAAYRDMAWMEYLYQLRGARNASFRPYLGRYLCADHTSRLTEEPIDSLKITFMMERTPPPGRPMAPVEREVLWAGECP
jgi:hypothetical protein